MRAQNRIFSVAATIALLAAASPAFAQVYIGSDDPTVEVNLEALNALPQTGPVTAKAVRLRHPQALRQPNRQVTQYDAELETTVVGGGGEQLAQISDLKPISGRIVRTTSNALAESTLDPDVTLVGLQPAGDDQSPRVARRHRRQHRHHYAGRPDRPLPPGDAKSLISANPALQAHMMPAEMTAEDLNYLQRVCALEPKPPVSPLQATPISDISPVPVLTTPAPQPPPPPPEEDRSVAPAPEQHSELDPPAAPTPAPPPPEPKPAVMAVSTDTGPAAPAPAPIAQASDDTALPPSKPKPRRKTTQAAANTPASTDTTPQPVAPPDPNPPVETQGRAIIPDQEAITPVQPPVPMILDRATVVEAQRPASPAPIQMPPAPEVASMPVPAANTVEPPAVTHPPVEVAAITPAESLATPESSSVQPAAVAAPGRTAPSSSASSDDELRIDYRPGSLAIPQDGTAHLDDLVQRLQGNADLRVELRSYASGSAVGSSKARRISLSRALNVRSYLSSHGIDPNRIDIRALGADPSQPSVDRVDFFLMR